MPSNKRKVFLCPNCNLKMYKKLNFCDRCGEDLKKKVNKSKTKKGRKKEIKKGRNEKKSRKISYKPKEPTLEPSKPSSLISISNESSALSNFINKDTRIFLIGGHSFAYSHIPNFKLKNPVKIKYDMKYFSKKRLGNSRFETLENFRHLIMQKKGNPHFFDLTEHILDIIYYYNNFYKKMVDCDDNNKAKKLNKELLKYGNLRDKKFIVKKDYQLYLKKLQNTEKMITNFKLYSKNSNDKLPQRVFDFIESIFEINHTTGKKYFNYDAPGNLKIFGIFELTNFNRDINSYEIINFFQSDVVNLIFKAQVARFKYKEITVLDLLEAFLRIPNKQTRYLLLEMGTYGITILNYLDKISNFNRLILEKYKNIIKNIILVEYPGYKRNFLPDPNRNIEISNSEETLENMFSSSSSSEETMENIFSSEETIQNFSELKNTYDINYLSKKLGLQETKMNKKEYFADYTRRINTYDAYNYSLYETLMKEWEEKLPNINDFYFNQSELDRYFNILLEYNESFNIKEIYELIIEDANPKLNQDTEVLVLDGGCNSFISQSLLNSKQRKQVNKYHMKMNSNK